MLIIQKRRNSSFSNQIYNKIDYSLNILRLHLFKYLELNEKKKKLERNIVIYICINTTFDDVYPSSILSK